MSRFSYIARDGTGRSVRALQDAESARALVSSLRLRGLTPISVEEIKPKPGARAKPAKVGRKKIKLKEVAVFSRQLTTMLKAGLTIVSSIGDIGAELENLNFQRILKDVRDDIEGGSTFSEALSRHPGAFSILFISMVRAGEAGGNLEGVLEELASYLEGQVALRKKIKSATSYPIFIGVFVFLALCGVIFFLIPKFQEMFASFGAELPLLTLIIMNISNFATHNILAIIGVAFVMGILFRVFSRTEVGRYQIDRLKLKLPIFGKMVHKAILTRFARTLGTLLASGVSIVLSLEMVAKISGNVLVERALAKVRAGVIGGSTIAEELGKHELFPRLLIRMVSVGEKSGKISEMLEKLSDSYDEELDATISGLTSIIEPLLIVCLGGIVGIVVIAIYFPIFKLAATMR